jgi:transcription elongation factor GreB
MNKAFTKESDADDDDDGPSLPALPPGGKNYITPAGHERLRAELLHLIDEDRPTSMARNDCARSIAASAS